MHENRKSPSNADSGKPAQRRSRRSAGEIIERLIDAAVDEFSTHGYAGARTAAIAQRAGVVEPLLFKHFGSKANLFQRAIFSNLDRHYQAFISQHQYDVSSNASMVETTRDYIGQQQDFLKGNSRMFLSLILQETFNSAEAEPINGMRGIQQFLDKMSAFAEVRHSQPGANDAKLIARISFASLMACVLFRDWLFPDKMASEDHIRNAVIDFVMKGADILPNSG